MSTGKRKSCLSEAIVRISFISNYSIMECHKGVNFPAQFVVRIQHSPTCWIQLLLSLLVQVSLDFLQAGFISERILIDGGLNLPATNGSTLKIDIPKRKIYFAATMHFQVLLLLETWGGILTLMMSQTHISTAINWQCFLLFWIAPTVVGAKFWRWENQNVWK